MASKKTRFFMGFMAILFLVTASATTVAVVWDAISNKDNNQAKEQKVNPNQLQGKPLANFTPLTTPVDKVQATDLKVGTGEEVKAGATITFHYTGALAANGMVFQSSHDGPNQPVAYPLKDLIKGWQEGIPGMKVGGQRRLLIPYAEGYGEAGSPQGGIPPKADLVFDIEVTDVKNP
jgi:FKBP-type peptidyl-prolyl cis-trans isomerase